MAKQKNDTLARLAKLNGAIEKKITASEKVGFDVFKKFPGISEYISCGNYVINAVLSGSLFGGVPNNRSIELAGKSGTGKTFFAMNIVREMNYRGYYVYYIDTEGATDDSDFQRFGCDPEMVQIIRTCDTYMKVKFFVNTLIDQVRNGDFEGIKLAVFVDSYGMLNTDKEKEDAKKGKNAADMGLRAKEGRQMFRTFTLDLANLGIPFVFTNHTGASLDLFAPGDIPSGGEGPTFAASIILLMDKKPLRTGDGDSKTQTGVVLRIKSHKNRLAQPHEAHAHLSWRNGMNKYVGLEEHLGWDNCGIVRGTILTEDEFKKKYKKGVAVNSTGKELVTHWFEREEPDPQDAKKKTLVKYACVESDNAKTWAVKDTAQNVPIANLWSSEVFTENSIKQMDEVVIKPMYRYSTIEEQLQMEAVELGRLADESEGEIKLIDENVLNDVDEN
jgi:RecA/RadA recombinase